MNGRCSLPSVSKESSNTWDIDMSVTLFGGEGESFASFASELNETHVVLEILSLEPWVTESREKVLCKLSVTVLGVPLFLTRVEPSSHLGHHDMEWDDSGETTLTKD